MSNTVNSPAGHSTPRASDAEPQWFGHPRGLFVLFSTELWERFSFYSMRAFLVLYMTKALAFNKELGNGVYGAYLGFVYAAPFFGGMLADRLLGQRRAIVTGGLLMAAAQFTLALQAILLHQAGGVISQNLKAMFFVALGLMSCGNGFFKPNISSVVGSLYERGDARRDGAFTIFYMGINIGALLGGFSGWAAESYGWHWGFLMAGVGMVIGQFIFFGGSHQLGDKGHAARPGAIHESVIAGIPNYLLVALGVIAFIPTTALLIAHPLWVQKLALIVSVPILLYLVYEALRSGREERDRLIALISLCCFSILFWAAFDLAGSALNTFTDEHVNRVVPVIGEIKASFLTASTNALFIVLLAVPFAGLWLWLNRRKIEPSSPLKFALGMGQMALGFYVLYLGATRAEAHGRCNLLYLIVGFLLHTTGELCISPVGLSTMTKLAPVRMASTVMGVWFFSTAMGDVLSGWIGGWTEHSTYTYVFRWVASATGIAAAVILVTTPILKKLMHGVK